jgi:hypothetical protein
VEWILEKHQVEAQMTVEIKTHPGKSLCKHILHTPKKRKKKLSLVEMKAPEYHGIPHDMDMDEIIEELD